MDGELSISPEAALAKGQSLYRARDYKDGFCWVYQSAMKRNIEATLLYGVTYLAGWTGTTNPKEAFDAFTFGAQNGNPYGEYLLGKCYEQGLGTPADSNLAAYWTSKAAQTPEGKKLVAEDQAEAAQKAQAGAQSLLFFLSFFGSDDGDKPYQDPMCGGTVGTCIPASSVALRQSRGIP
jgi:hypothetical protein